MRLRYTDEKEEVRSLQLSEEEVILGRSEGAQVFINDPRVSRNHAAIRYWGGDYVLKDLHSNNGTLVNGRTVNVTALSPADRIVIGGTELIVEDENQPQKGTGTVMAEVGSEFDRGKGYSTIMRQFVDEASQEQKERRRQTNPPGEANEEDDNTET